MKEFLTSSGKYPRRYILILISVAILAVGLNVPTIAESEEPPPSSATINLIDAQIAQQLATLPTRKVLVRNDKLYGGDHEYEGYKIEAVIAWLSQRTRVSVDNAAMSLIASDGYLSRVSLRELPKRAGILAFRESGGSREKPFRDSKSATVPFNPGPYYLIWEGTFDDKLPTPWGVTSVSLAADDIPAEHIPPHDTPQLNRGLEIWRTHCSKCHAINKIGGTMGPELNVPKNVTEYWQPERLRELIENPATLRWGSKMPPYNWMPTGDREAILAYLAAMKEKKVCNSEVTCH